MLQRLKTADGLAELLADAQIVESDLLRLLHHAQQFGRQGDERKIGYRFDRTARRLARRDEIGGRMLKGEGCKLAAVHRLRCRQSAPGSITGHIVKRSAVSPAG